MRTRPLVALVLAVIVAAPAFAGHGAPSEPLRFTPVPDGPTPTPIPSADSSMHLVWDGQDAGVPGGRHAPAVAQPRPRATAVSGLSGGVRRLAGTASWYCGHGSHCTRGYPGGLYAAAGPPLRVGDWRGRVVTVSAAGRSVRVRLIDWCACPHRALDLYRDAFARLADPSRGLLKVTVHW